MQRIAFRKAVILAAVSAGMLCMVSVASAATVASQPPRRVVSMNLCTDQLALMIAAPGQLIAVSHLASNPDASVLAEQAREIPVNYGQAEEIFLLHPDLIVAGTFTTRATVDLLRRLGFPVVEFALAHSLAEIRSNVLRMGELLGRQEKAASLVAEFDARIAAIKKDRGPRRPIIAPYYANSLTSGTVTLVDEAIEVAGLKNLGRILGLQGNAKLPLEILLMAQPDLLMFGHFRHEWVTQAQEVFHHPALLRAAQQSQPTTIPDKYLVCGTPHTIQAIEALAKSRADFLEGQDR